MYGKYIVPDALALSLSQCAVDLNQIQRFSWPARFSDADAA